MNKILPAINHYKASTNLRKLTYLIFVIWILLLVKLTLFKNPLALVYMHFNNYAVGTLENSFHRASLLPFVTLNDLIFIEPSRAFAYRNLLGNVLMFVPAGFLLPELWPKLNKPFKLLQATFLISLTLETLQLITALGDFDVDDLLLNTLGGFVGFVAYTFLQNSKRRNLNLR